MIKTGPNRTGMPCSGIRSAFILGELIVASVVLIVLMTFVTSICYRVHWTWNDVREQRIAVGELSSQLDRLTLLPGNEVERELESMIVSPECLDVLPEARIVGEVTDDLLGKRITLRMTWKRKIPRKPVVLSGWIVELEDGADDG